MHVLTCALLCCCQVEMRVSGDGVTPFGPANQQRLINVFADVARNNLTQDQFRIVLVSDAYTSRRRLMVRHVLNSTMCSSPRTAHHTVQASFALSACLCKRLPRDGCSSLAKGPEMRIVSLVCSYACPSLWQHIDCF